MQIYQGIQLVYAHIQQLLIAVKGWFSAFDWSGLIETFPLPFQATISACFVVILALAGIGLVKKLSFMLG